MNVLDLFSGIGGFSLGLERAGMRTVAFCEIDKYCQSVLRKHWPTVPIFEDVRKLSGANVGAAIDLVCGGFPCQPYSVAGDRLGAEDDRALWPEYRRLIEELRPTWVIGENVVGIVGMDLDNVLADLEALGYATRAFDIPACAVGANHERRRIWIVAHAGGNRPQGVEDSGITQESWQKRTQQLERLHASERAMALPAGKGGGVSDGLPNRVDRIGALGNAVVPQIPEIIGRAILKCAMR